MAEVLGWYATIAFSINFVPQIVKMVRTKSVDDLSPTTFFLGGTAGLANVVYLAIDGKMDEVVPIVTNNAATAFMCTIVLILYFAYKKRPTEIHASSTVAPAPISERLERMRRAFS